MSNPVLALRYMNRFGCVGAECEATCCSGWEVQLGAQDLQRLEQTLRQTSAGRAMYQDRVATLDGDPTRGRMKLSDCGDCPFLATDRLCDLHRTHGEAVLPDTCALYPRALHQIDGRLELSAHPSCPEAARQLLLHPDAIDVVTLNPDRTPRAAPQQTIATRTASPYERTIDAVRPLMMQLAALDRPLSLRLRVQVAVATTLSGVIHRAMGAEDEAAARGLIARFENPAVLSDLSASLEATPSSGVSGLAVLAQLVLLRSQKAHRSAGARFMAMWRESVDAQLGPAEAILGDPAAAWTQHAAAVQRIDAILPGRLAGYSQNLVGNYWFGRLFTASDSPLVHAQHLLLLHGVIRLSLVHDPRVVHALDQPAEALSDALSAAVVQVTWQTYRALEHHKLLTVLQQALAEDRSGGVTHSLCTI